MSEEGLLERVSGPFWFFLRDGVIGLAFGIRPLAVQLGTPRRQIIQGHVEFHSAVVHASDFVGEERARPSINSARFQVADLGHTASLLPLGAIVLLAVIWR